MDQYPLGVTVVVPISITDPTTGDPVNPGSPPTLALYHPDGVTVESLPTTAHTDVGEYEVALQPSTLDEVGPWRVIPTVTGANIGADFEVFSVFDPVDFPRLVSFADAKIVVKALGDQDDPLLDRMIGWASARILIEYQAYRQTFTQTVNVRGGDCFFTLSHTPVRSITSVTALGAFSYPAPAVSTLVPTIPNAGHVEATYGGMGGVYEVTYVAGSDEVPPGVDGACLALIQHWWGQIVSRRSASYGAPGGAMPDFRGLPNTVMNLLASVPSPRGFA